MTEFERSQLEARFEAARAEAEAAVAEAEEKVRAFRDMRWEVAGAGFDRDEVREMLSPGWNEMMAVLDKLPDVDWQSGCFYSEHGDHLEVYWAKPERGTVVKWVNHFISLSMPIDEDGNLGEVPVGCQISEVKGMLERAGVYLTPDPPNPSREVQEAKAAGVCRVCRNPLVDGAAPAKAAERFGSSLTPNAMVFNYGEEYAHQACLNQEKAEGEAA